jgi:hypothetical protein
MDLDKVQWMIEEGKSTMDTRPFLLALADNHLDVNFAIARWLISNGHVDAKKELRILLDDYMFVTVQKLLRLVEIGEIDNIEEEDAYVMWKMESVYTTNFLRVMLPRSDPPPDIRTRLLQDESQKDIVLSGLELRKKLSEFLKDRRQTNLMGALDFLPNVLRQEIIKLEEGSLSTDEMWKVIGK